jgi:MSHA pilin protein MshD
VEAIVAIVIVAIAAVTILAQMSQANVQSGSQWVQLQARSIADAYLLEIMRRPFDDPDGADGEASRGQFDDVDDYHGLNDGGARDATGNPLPGGGSYTVAVQVLAHGSLPGVPASDARLITVTVADPVGGTAVARGLRLRP